MTRVEARPLGHGFAAVYIPRNLPAAEEQALRERLGLVCRHGRNVRVTTGRCPACAVKESA